MLRAAFRFDLAFTAGTLFVGLVACSSDPPTTPGAGAGGGPISTAGASSGGAAGTGVSGATFGGSSNAGAAGLAITPGTAGALSAGGGGSPGTAGSNTAGTPGAGQGGQSQAGAGGTTSGGAGGMSGGSGTAGMAGMAGMGMAGAMNPPGTCNNTYSGFTNYNGNGSVTYYTFGMGTGDNVHCSYGITQRNPDTVGLVHQQRPLLRRHEHRRLPLGAACGSCVEVSGSDGRKVVVTVVDECPIGTNPKCTAGHLDLSHEAFRQIASDQEGHVGTGHGGCCRQISWKYVPCPVPESQNVTFRLKEPNNQYYTTVVVQDHRFPIKSLQIKGVEAKRQPDNFWIVGDGNQSPGPWHVRAVDVNDWIFEGVLEGGKAGDVSSGTRAVCQ